jgi:hypothetical protein
VKAEAEDAKATMRAERDRRQKAALETTKSTGVTWYKKNSKWLATMRFNGGGKACWVF